MVKKELKKGENEKRDEKGKGHTKRNLFRTAVVAGAIVLATTAFGGQKAEPDFYSPGARQYYSIKVENCASEYPKQYDEFAKQLLPFRKEVSGQELHEIRMTTGFADSDPKKYVEVANYDLRYLIKAKVKADSYLDKRWYRDALEVYQSIINFVGDLPRDSEKRNVIQSSDFYGEVVDGLHKSEEKVEEADKRIWEQLKIDCKKQAERVGGNGVIGLEEGE